ncbi:Hypp9617 [Branchiostoma lanceolatum]|uniref:Hypp9617 protein n=1 Tax=Branchiostoma lanceolatum TaxID=7740 RepID=A0A8S4MNR2_BRALA|nr:Hypp9617 [Branchiostoma lanceolatum]
MHSTPRYTPCSPPTQFNGNDLSRANTAEARGQAADRKQPRVTWSPGAAGESDDVNVPPLQARLRQRSIRTMPPTESAKRRGLFLRKPAPEIQVAIHLSWCGRGRALSSACFHGYLRVRWSATPGTEPRPGEQWVPGRSAREQTRDPLRRSADDAMSSATSRVCIWECAIPSVQLPGDADGQINPLSTTTEFTRP